MSEKRFRANFDVSIYDSETEEYISTSERGLEEIAKRMNEQQATIKNLYDEIHSLKKIIKEQTLRVYCQDQEIQKLINQLEKIPPKIRDVWL